VSESSWGFQLDRFQTEAISAVNAGHSVLVAAPTSSGKTVVAEHAIDVALEGGLRAFYTTPIKALSNQKFSELKKRVGAERVGLLTGDLTINPMAPVLVMTTEVLRNMLYTNSETLDGLAWVVLDEVHYLEDPYRGPVWEEVILGLPKTTQVIALSATVSNVKELGEWLSRVKEKTEIVVHEKRPVPLKLHYCAASRSNHKRRLEQIPLLIEGKSNPAGKKFSYGGRKRRDAHYQKRFSSPHYIEVVESLKRQELLPTIHFIFSRAGCDAARDRVLKTGVSLNNSNEQKAVDEIVLERLKFKDPEDMKVLKVDEWATGLRRGIASHHAGHIPIFKEITEELFVKGLLKVVYATETLALGVNLPARSVVLDKMTKFTGENHEFLTSSQFTQITGRAGRRGLDKEGHGIILWSPFVEFREVAELALNKSFYLKSAFHPTYNMVANLMNTRSQLEAEELLKRSFGQFQLDNKRNRHEKKFQETRVQVTLLEEDLADLTRENFERSKVSALQPGDIVLLEDGQIHAILTIADRSGNRRRIKTINQMGKFSRFASEGILNDPLRLSKVETLDHAYLRDSETHREMVAFLRELFTLEIKKIGQIRRKIFKLKKQIHDSELDTPKINLVDQLAVTGRILELRGLSEGWRLTEAGQLLTRIYSECDLVIVEALKDEIFEGLNAAELAAVVSVFVYSHRGRPDDFTPLKNKRVGERIQAIEKIAKTITDLEWELGMDSKAILDSRYAEKIYSWASGQDLSAVLDSATSGGEFVRNVRLVSDLLRQIRTIGNVELQKVAAESIKALERGVVVVTAAFEDVEEDLEAAKWV